MDERSFFAVSRHWEGYWELTLRMASNWPKAIFDSALLTRSGDT